MKKEIDTSQALAAYFKDTVSYCEPYGNGYINDTFLVVCLERRYIMQRINTSVFPRPVELMENILNVTRHIREKVEKTGGDVSRCTLVVLPTLSGENYFKDSENGYWRLYEFTEGTVALEQVESVEQFYKCGKAFGVFQKMLCDFPAKTLHEPLANLHNTPWRYDNLMLAAEKDVMGRLCEVEELLRFARDREAFCHVLENAHKEGRLPLHVTHNDTKLNNILFDEVTGEPVCAIDLDTVMPGYAITDFGDSIRSGANTAGDGETDLSKVKVDLVLFEAYAKGFLQGCGGSLTKDEISLMASAALLITLECGMRFLTDYLQGDTYFKIKYPKHNLDRARNQFALLADMERNFTKMQAIIEALTA